MNSHGKKALITGINGFTGQYMAAELSSAGYHVYGFGTAAIGAVDNCIQVDLTDSEQTRQAINKIAPDIVVHLAAISFVGHANPQSFYEVNLLGTRNLLQALVDAPDQPDAILIASSANVYGNNTPGSLSESSLVNPANDYAVSKLAMEYMAKLFMDKLPIIITRPFNYTGVGQQANFLIPKIVQHFRQRKPVIELGNIDVWRDFSDVRYVTKSYLALLQAAAFGNIVNVASGQMHSLRQIINLCEELTGFTLRIEVNPHFVRANEVKQLCGDVSLLCSLTTNTLQTIPLRETLKWMLEAKS